MYCSLVLRSTIACETQLVLSIGGGIICFIAIAVFIWYRIQRNEKLEKRTKDSKMLGVSLTYLLDQLQDDAHSHHSKNMERMERIYDEIKETDDKKKGTCVETKAQFWKDMSGDERKMSEAEVKDWIQAQGDNQIAGKYNPNFYQLKVLTNLCCASSGVPMAV